MSGLARLPSGARASHVREFPIHGYVEPSVLHPFPNSREPMISMCRDRPGFRLAPEPATFRSFLYTDMWSPPCSIHAQSQDNQWFLCVELGWASVWRPSQPHSGVSMPGRHVVRSALRAPIKIARSPDHPISVTALPRRLVGAPRTNLSPAPAHDLARWASRPLTSETHRPIAMREPDSCAGHSDFLTPNIGYAFS